MDVWFKLKEMKRKTKIRELLSSDRNQSVWLSRKVN